MNILLILAGILILIAIYLTLTDNSLYLRERYNETGKKKV